MSIRCQWPAMKSLLFAGLLPLLIAGAPPGDIIAEADLRAHIAELASDAYQGRAPGTEGQTRTIGYIADQFSKAGLVSAATDRPWFQTVTLVERSVSASSAIFTRDGKPLALDPGQIALRGWQPLQAVRAASVVFFGYGISDALPDPSGAVVLLLRDTPQGSGEIPDFATRRNALLRGGAAAVIGIAGGETAFESLRRGYRRGGTALASAVTPGIDGVMTLEAASALFHSDGIDVAALVEEAGTPDYKGRAIGLEADLSVEMTLRRYDSFNVIGKVEGSAPEKGAVLVTGHWDHLGLCRSEGAADRICNGAVDNASGIALMIEVARKLRFGPQPVRDIYFVATTAEENGLLGARAFVERPAVPLDRIQAVLNVDTVALAPKGTPIAVIGRGGKLDAPIARAAAITGRAIDPDNEADEYLSRQDGAVFAEKGIPAVMLVSAFSDKPRLDAYLSSRYHGPDDELTDTTELGGAAEDATFHVVLARLLADPKEFSR
ncbi:M20/M25/M40 family metallo-hydrolase [Sphingomonas cavernae]|uniref:M20/M25/M40 family metallo-hydrolase n=1 Tax=Sphingomonas cavernae TaxID=2320861 RepID=A0A418WN24_9SPHN|nr:M20/M25/M40 family metallo-hydrolase [Sphingomonas cavernae]RJF91401.1 M20/M25/M40 family metallo-hydrolase [Sphingomonas cavernae]